MGEELLIIGGCWCAFGLCGLLLAVLFLLAMMRCLQACSERTRTMAPGLVWLNLIPVVNWFWQFWTVIQIGNSLRREYDDRGMGRRDDTYGKVLGVITCSLATLCTVIGWCGGSLGRLTGEYQVAELASCGTVLLALPWLILWVVYWSKIVGYTKELNVTRGRSAFDEDDRPRRPTDGDEGPDGGWREHRSRRDDFDDDYRPRNRY